MRPNHPIEGSLQSAEPPAWRMSPRSTGLEWLRSSVLVAGVVLTQMAMATADLPEVGTAATLQATYGALHDKLRDNQFNLPLSLDSQQAPGRLRGDIHAVVDYPFATVSTALEGAPHWSDILPLHLNVKYCRASADERGDRLTLYIGRKFDQRLDAGHRMEFAFKVTANTPDYF